MVFIRQLPDSAGDGAQSKLTSVLAETAVPFWVGRGVIILGLFRAFPQVSPDIIFLLGAFYLLSMKLLHHAVSSRLAPGEPPPLIWKRGWILIEDPLLELLWRRRRL